MQFVLFCILLGGQFVHVEGWGAEGHGIIARLAQSELTASVSSWVQDLLPWHWNGSLSSMASWADSIIHANSNPTGSANWQWSRPLHYINTPDWSCAYHVDRDCVNNVCIDGAVRNYTKRLAEELDRTQQQEALYFLIHFVGDMHQPLHIGFTSDYGGNSVEGRSIRLDANRSRRMSSACVSRSVHECVESNEPSLSLGLGHPEVPYADRFPFESKCVLRAYLSTDASSIAAT